MGSLSITPFSCTHPAIHNTEAIMKVFATLATIMGVAYATPEAQTHTLPPQVKAIRSSGLEQQNNVMGMSTVLSNVKMASPYQAQAGPRQYHLQDEFGNFEYAYANKDSEKMEKGNDILVRGRYAYIMSDGVLRRVDYIADNDGFHILQDNADSSKSQNRIKRSVEPNLLQTRITSFMDSSALRDNSLGNSNPPLEGPLVYNLMGRDMSKNVMQGNRMNQMSSQRNMYGLMDRSSKVDKNMKDSKMMNEKMMGLNIMDEKKVGRNRMDENMMGRNMMGQNMHSNVMGRDMSSNVMNRNMIGQENMRNMMGQEMMEKNMMGRNIIGQKAYSNMMDRDMSSHVMNRNMISQDMLNLNMMGKEMSSNVRDTSSTMMNAYSNDVNRLPLGQLNTMSQRMQIPQSVASRNTFF